MVNEYDREDVMMTGFIVGFIFTLVQLSLLLWLLSRAYEHGEKDKEEELLGKVIKGRTL